MAPTGGKGRSTTSSKSQTVPASLESTRPTRKRKKHLRNSCDSSTDSDHAPTVTAATCPVDATPQADFMDTGVVSDATGVITDAEENALSPEPGMPFLSVPYPSLSPSSNPASDPIPGAQPHAPSVFPPASRTSTTLTPTTPTSARLDMSSISPLPPTTSKLYVTSADPDKKLTQMNPCLLQQEVDLLLGPIHTIEYLRSGSLLLTTKTFNQVSLLLDATHLPTSKIPITSTVAWNQQFTYGKLYAREFSFDSLETTLEYFRPHNVVAIRRLRLSSSAPSHLYVLTFVGPTPPKLQVGYSIYIVDRYVSQPLRCYHCWRFRHSAAQCRSRALCSYCSSSLNTKDACTATAPKCIKCAGPHPSNSATCPIFIYEQEICHLQASAGISFLDARSRVAEARAKRLSLPREQRSTYHQPSFSPSSTTTTSTPPLMSLALVPPPAISSTTHFPSLSHVPSSTASTLHSPPSHPPSSSLHTPLFSDVLSSVPSLLPDTSPPHHPSYPSQLSLPPLPPSHMSSSSSQTHPPLPQIFTDPTPHRPSLPAVDLTSLLTKLLPLNIRLLFATTITDKIECIIHIGHVLQLDSLVTTVLSSLDVTSRSSSQ